MNHYEMNKIIGKNEEVLVSDSDFVSSKFSLAEFCFSISKLGFIKGRETL